MHRVASHVILKRKRNLFSIRLIAFYFIIIIKKKRKMINHCFLFAFLSS
jgi:hypothetical protein